MLVKHPGMLVHEEEPYNAESPAGPLAEHGVTPAEVFYVRSHGAVPPVPDAPRLTVGGLVATPLFLSLADLRALPNRRQITRHDCVEGWSAIGQWTGPMLGNVLKAAGVSDRARYIVFTCADYYGGAPYYESIDLVDAFHPQTILAWAMNDRFLDVGHGAPLRLRVERQLGYKQAKYLMRVTAVESLAGVGKGRGGYWEDNVDYDWWAGI